jgi:DNA-binding MarR family transcriptional regulator
MTSDAPRPAAPDTRLSLDAYLPYRLSVAANAVSQLIAHAYEGRFGVNIPQWRIIANLADLGPSTPQRLGERVAMDKVTVSRAARDLLKRGMVARHANPEDGRSHFLVLTARGEDLYAAITPFALSFERALLEGWPDGEIQRLHQQLERLQRTASDLATGALES